MYVGYQRFSVFVYSKVMRLAYIAHSYPIIRSYPQPQEDDIILCRTRYKNAPFVTLLMSDRRYYILLHLKLYA